MQIVLLSLIIVAIVALLVSQALPVEITALLGVFALAVTGILTPAEALSGFSNEATVTVAAMFMLSAGLARTGAMGWVAALLGQLSSGRFGVLLAALGLVAAIPSAFLNNTPIVIILVPVVLALCHRFELSPSKLLIPLSYFAILGGTLTLVGTSTNILVDSLYREAGGTGFSMFEFTGMGLVYLLVGGTFLLLFSHRLLPERTVLSQLLEPAQRTNFVTEISLRPGSSLVGTTLRQLVPRSSEVRILELVRGEEVQLGPEGTTELEAEDSLLIEGSPRSIHSLLQHRGLDLASAVEDARRVKIDRLDLVTFEAVVTPNSPFAGQRLREIGLNRLYGIKVLAIQRLGRHHRVQLRSIRLRQGDVLLVQGEQGALQALRDSGRVLLIEGVEKTLTFPARAPLAIAIMAAVVGAAAVGLQPLSILALGGAAVMVLTRCLRSREALRALDSSVLLLIAGTIPLGLAMDRTGLAEIIAHGVLALAEAGGPVLLVSGLYLLTSTLTAFLSNNAAAVLLTPIALRIAIDTGIDPKPLLIAIAFGASASFATPIGYQTNLMVMGPGGYFFRDYLRIGLPLTVVLWLVATLLIPVFWPL